MAKLTKKTFIESLKEMNIKEIMELVDAIKEEFGIDPTAIAVANNEKSDTNEVEEKSEFTVNLKSFGGNKVAVIKVVKELLGLGLMDAKKLVESAPVSLKKDLKKEEAEEIKTNLETAGAEIELI